MLQLNGVDYRPVTIDDIFSDNKLTLPPERYGETLIGGSDSFFSKSFSSEPFQIIFVTRDIRDALASHLKLTRSKFENSLDNLEAWIRRNLAFLDLPPERCLQLQYEEDVLDLPNACKKIARFLGLEILEANIVEICEIFSRQAIKKHSDAEVERFFSAAELLEETSKDNLKFIVSSQENTRSINIPVRMCRLSESRDIIFVEIPNYDPFVLTSNFDGTVRLKFNSVLEDSKTDGFQQGHVSSENVHPWKTFFSIEQKELINSEILRVLKTVPFLPESFIMNVLSNDDAFKSLDNFRPIPDLDIALQHHKAGRFHQAETLYKKTLQTDPDQPVALHLLGLIFHQLGQNDIACDFITKSLNIKPDYVEAKDNLNVILRALGKMD